MSNMLPFVWWDCMPLLMVISPIIVDFIIYKIKKYRLKNQEKAKVGFRTIFLFCLLVFLISFILIFLTTIFILDFKISSVLLAMLISLMVVVLIFYKRMFKMRFRRNAGTKIGRIFPICLAMALLILNICSFFVLGFRITEVILILTIASAMMAILVFCKKRQKGRDHEGSEMTGRSFIAVCLAIAGLIIVLPLTNFWIGVPAGGWKYRWMERFKGESTKTFVAVFGQPIRSNEGDLYYGKFLWYDYLMPEDHLFVIVESDRIKGFIWD